jgi:polyisoprenoid-binding protein YceI
MNLNTAPTRTVDGHKVPPAGRWTIDPSHSHIEFVARHMMIAKVRGRFRDISGTIDIGEDPLRSHVTVVMNAASIDTGEEDRDRHLRSLDFLDVDRYPEIRFVSTSVRPGTGDRWEVVGDLTVRSITKPVTVAAEFCGTAIDPWGRLRAAFLATADINREEFDVSWNQILESGGFLVDKGVKVEADIEAVADSANADR